MVLHVIEVTMSVLVNYVAKLMLSLGTRQLLPFTDFSWCHHNGGKASQFDWICGKPFDGTTNLTGLFMQESLHPLLLMLWRL